MKLNKEQMSALIDEVRTLAETEETAYNNGGWDLATKSRCKKIGIYNALKLIGVCENQQDEIFQKAEV